MFTEINGLKTYFECFGQGKPLILLHGWGVDSQIWQEVAERLAADFKVVTVDLPGFGRSDRPPKAWGVSDYADFVEKFIEELELAPLVLLGYSFGGRIAIAAASLNPSYLEKLILVSCAGIKHKSFRRLFFWGAAKLGKEFFSLPVLKTVKEPARRFLYHIIKEEDYLKSGNLKETLLKVINQDLTSMLQKIKVPTLIIWGEKDKIMPVSDGKKMHQFISNSQFEIIKGAGHFCFLEKPGEFCEIVRESVILEP